MHEHESKSDSYLLRLIYRLISEGSGIFSLQYWLLQTFMGCADQTACTSEISALGVCAKSQITIHPNICPMSRKWPSR